MIRLEFYWVFINFALNNNVTFDNILINTKRFQIEISETVSLDKISCRLREIDEIVLSGENYLLHKLSIQNSYKSFLKTIGTNRIIFLPKKINEKKTKFKQLRRLPDC